MRTFRIKHLALISSAIACTGLLSAVAYNQIAYRGTKDFTDHCVSYAPDGFFHHKEYFMAKDKSWQAVESAGLTDLFFGREIAIDENNDGNAEQVMVINPNLNLERLRSGRFWTAPEGEIHYRSTTEADDKYFIKADVALNEREALFVYSN
jgi:hypothetical protein